MKTYWGVEVYLHVFLISALDEGEWLASRPGRFTPRERAAGTHQVRGWVSPRASLDMVSKSQPVIEPRSSDRPVRGQSLYRLSYADTQVKTTGNILS
jgi:hypothetical protein